MLIRAYLPADAEVTLSIYTRAIRTISSRDYSPEQIAAWAPDSIDIETWAAKRAANDTVVATIHDRVAGFTDLHPSGYIGVLFVDPHFTRRGVASALMSWIEGTARERGLDELSSHVSLTAKSFFERHHFEVVERRHPVVTGVTMTNFHMRRVLQPAHPAHPQR
jgi:putative acetyltransferase